MSRLLVLALLAFSSLAVARTASGDAVAEWPGSAAVHLPDIYASSKAFHVRGMIVDAFHDDIDTRHVFLAVRARGEIVYAPILMGATPFAAFEKLVGAEVEFVAHVTAVPATDTSLSLRLFTGPLFLIDGYDRIRVVTPPRLAPFDVPPLGDLSGLDPATIAGLGRRRVVGRVEAAWNGHDLLLATASNRTVRVELAGADLPAWGQTVEVTGFVGTDVFRLNLTRAAWRPAPDAAIPPPVPTADVTLAQLCQNKAGERQFQFRYHGRRLRLSGVLRSLPPSDDRDGAMLVESGGLMLPVNTSACPEARDGLEVGQKLAVTGVCVMDVEGWRPNDIFPPIRGPLLVVRDAADVVVTARAPWLTPLRALVLVLVLAGALVGILIWNRALQTLADRRGRALLKQELESVRSQMCVVERTRLAVELHDSVAQMLTGVALELEAARGAAPDAPAARDRHMDIAIRALDACRDELRNCLWDLRSDALDETTMDAAIRRTLLPHCKGVATQIRFNVPRAAFSDNTAHAVICIVRELVLNAIRHGKAANVRIAGVREDETISFSVQDDGCGFDPESAPGVADGHFGLQGMRERVHKLNGTFTISSAPGRGTKATVTLRAPLHDITRGGGCAGSSCRGT